MSGIARRRTLKRAKMSKPSQRTIKRQLNDLRALIDTSKDQAVTRIAYGMECAIRWVIEDTVGWEMPAQNAIELAAILRKDLKL